MDGHALSSGHFRGDMNALSRDLPATSRFADIAEATEFVFQLEGSCGYDYASNRLSFQRIEYPPWSLQFCHRADYSFALLDHLCEAYELRAEFDCVLFMQKVPQVWGSSWLYPATPQPPPRLRAVSAP
jgi:hypothetical protein